MESSKPVVDLWDTVGVGLIVNYPTGILISNQTGGISCIHPSLEGFYVPLHNCYTETEKQFMSPALDLETYFTGPKHNGSGATLGLDEEDFSTIIDILTRHHLHDMIIVDKEKMTLSHEAWVHVKIHNLYLLSGFPEKLDGVLTWNNSD